MTDFMCYWWITFYGSVLALCLLSVACRHWVDQFDEVVVGDYTVAGDDEQPDQLVLGGQMSLGCNLDNAGPVYISITWLPQIR